MPIVRPYQQQIAPSGVVAPHATPKMAGSDVGKAALQGAQNVARAVAGYEARKTAVEDDQARMWAATASAEQEVGLRQSLADRVNAMNPEAQDYGAQIASLTDQTEADFEDSTQALLDRAPNDAARRYIAMHAASSRVRLTDSAIHTQAELNAAFSTRIASNGIKANSQVLAANPDNDSFQDIVGRTVQTLGALTTIAPDLKAKLAESAKHTFAQVQVTAISTQNPTGFLAAFSSARKATADAGVRDYGAPLVKPYTPAQAKKLAAQVAQASPYDAMFQAAGQKYGVDWRDLKLRAVAESGLDPDASSGQAGGIMQFSPAMAKTLGIDPNDPAQAIPAAAKLLAKYQHTASGDMTQVDKMYYGGAGGSSWGANTQQYAANLEAARAVLHGGAVAAPRVQPLTDQQILAAKVPLDGWAQLTPAEKISAVRHAESVTGKHLADDRGALTRELKDANATLLAGKAYPALGSPRYSEANLQRVFGADKGTRAYHELQYSQKVGSAVAGMATMPAAQRAATLTALQPQPGDDFAEREPKYEAALAAAQRVAKAQQKAPIQYAIEHGISGAKPLDFSTPEKLTASLRQRVQVAGVMHDDYGTPHRVFTGGEVEQLAAGLAKLSGRDRVQYLLGVRNGLDDVGAFGTAMNELAPKNPLLAYAANVAARPVHVEVDGQPVSSLDVATKIADGDIILNGRSLDKQMAKGAEPSMPSGADAVKLDETQFRTDFNAALGQTAFQLPDAQRGAAMQREVYNAVKAYYVADSYQKGQTLNVIDNDLVRQAIDAVTGGVWKGAGDGGVLLAPYGMPMDTFQAQWQTRATDAFKAAGYTPDAIDTGLDQLRPVTLANGKYGFVNGTRLMVSPKTGKPVVVDYRQPYQGPAIAPEQHAGALTMADLPNMGRFH